MNIVDSIVATEAGSVESLSLIELMWDGHMGRVNVANINHGYLRLMQSRSRSNIQGGLIRTRTKNPEMQKMISEEDIKPAQNELAAQIFFARKRNGSIHFPSWSAEKTF